MKKQAHGSGAEPKQRTLSELAGETGLAERTIRYYIARGLLAPPLGAGRGAAYADEHVERLKTIRQMQQRGLTLAEIGRVIEGGPGRLPEPAAWWSYRLAPDVIVQVHAGTSPWRVRQVKAAIAEMARRLGEETTEEEGKERKS